MSYGAIFNKNKEILIKGRYICLNQIEPVLNSSKLKNHISVVGKSVLENPIYAYKNGHGAVKIMMWSQMHGNESTTTKAVFDFFNFLNSEEGHYLKEKYTFLIIPMLNPDGAEAWTRNNANDIDLNRDSQELTQPESKILRSCIDEFKPDFCFNLHDQRTIYGVEGTNKSAAISFLAPSFNEAKDVNHTRKTAMEVVTYMNDALQMLIPGHIGRYDDVFNINCIGDTVQALNIPVVLVEAGHYLGDYERENTRKFVFIALISALNNLNLKSDLSDKYLEYFNIPNNMTSFFDFIYKNVKINYDGKQIITNFAVQFLERVENQKICFDPRIKYIGNDSNYMGHFEYDANEKEFTDRKENTFPTLDQKADFYIGETLFKNGYPIA